VCMISARIRGQAFARASSSCFAAISHPVRPGSLARSTVRRSGNRMRYTLGGRELTARRRFWTRAGVAARSIGCLGLGSDILVRLSAYCLPRRCGAEGGVGTAACHSRRLCRGEKVFSIVSYRREQVQEANSELQTGERSPMSRCETFLANFRRCQHNRWGTVARCKKPADLPVSATSVA